MERERMIVLTPPHRLGELRGRPVTPCHLAYRIGEGPHLMGSGLPASLRGGLMAVADGLRIFAGRSCGNASGGAFRGYCVTGRSRPRLF